MLGRHRERNLPVETARTQQSGIHVLNTIGRSDHHNIALGLETIHQRQQLCHQALVDAIGIVLARGRNRIDLIKEDDGALVRLRGGENHAQRFLTIAHILAHDGRAGHQIELRVRHIGDDAGQMCFAGARSTGEDHALDGLGTDRTHLRTVAQLRFDKLLGARDHLLITAERIEGKRRIAARRNAVLLDVVIVIGFAWADGRGPQHSFDAEQVGELHGVAGHD